MHRGDGSKVNLLRLNAVLEVAASLQLVLFEFGPKLWKAVREMCADAPALTPGPANLFAVYISGIHWCSERCK